MLTLADKINQATGESDPDWEKKATPEQLRAAELAAQAGERYQTEEQAEKALAEAGLLQEVRAKYKIEISFGPGRTTRGPNLAGIQVWESGKKLHGGGDELMFFCQDVTPGKNDGCWAVIPGDHAGYNQHTGKEVALCQKCNRVWSPEQLTSMRVFKTSTHSLATTVENLFRQLDSNADLYCKYHPTDIRYQAMLKDKGLETARRLKGMHMYRLARILRDTSAGASLHGRIVAFLSS